MFCNQAAKIVCGISAGCVFCGLIFTLVIPALLISSAASQVDDHQDGSAVTFLGGTTQVAAECTHADRNLGWGVWIATTENCATRYAGITVQAPPSQTTPLLPGAANAATVPVTTQNQCEAEPLTAVSAAATSHSPTLMKVASFRPMPELNAGAGAATLYNITVRTGTYTVNCGTAPCWVVDDREVMQAAVGAVASAVGTAFTGMITFALGNMFLVVSSILCWVSICIACCTEEPDARSSKGRLMDEEEGDDE